MIRHGHLGSVRGFTLIEIMIVVFIIGLMATVITLSVGEDKSKAAPRLEAQAFMQAVGFVSEFAALNGEVVAMFISPRESSDSLGKYWCYNWQRYRDNAWVKLPEDSLSEHCMDERVQWELVVEGHLYTYDPDLETQPPVLVFSPSGEATPVEMALFEQGTGTNTEAQHIEIDMMGNSHWREEDEAQKSNEAVR
ncbi:putative type II secretion system protein H [Cellvibrio zantedeschiae]|uniref:Type II secretion system protein H n=1 Tax=Cellvibrio zantedeschiae TaxID=1237077 RepID=A0ABQ3BA68_9GAMM|nr:prepilin-type N-terminal cleavage/methylation domain-containing protein [Cellvibrio zantedeschiae]GGY86842.1 putative type II secretion system protein H [Cellvibrio zantedeschiae]